MIPWDLIPAVGLMWSVCALQIACLFISADSDYIYLRDNYYMRSDVIA